MYIAKNNNGKIEVNNIFAPLNKLPTNLADEGWYEVTLVEEPREKKKFAYNFRQKYEVEGDLLYIKYEYDEYTIEQYREIINNNSKQAYINDVVWTDSCKMLYDKLKLSNPDDTEKDEWWTKILAYWAEATEERQKNKTNIKNAISLEELEKVSYNPIHKYTRIELE